MARVMKIGSDPQADASKTLRAAVAETKDEEERKLLEHVIETLDLSSYKDMQEWHLSLKSKPAKFLDLTAWIRHKYTLVKNLELDRASPMRILDIGCGPSQFGVVGRYFGHEVVGLDIPGNTLYGDLNDFFGLRRFVHAVRAMKPLPHDTGRYDLITALSANFYQKPDGTLFTVEEWQFFMKNIATDHLKPGGRIFFNLNPLSDHSGMHYWDDEFVQMMESHGGTVDRKSGLVTFDDASAWIA